MALSSVQARAGLGRLFLGAAALGFAFSAPSSCVLTERELGANLTCESGACQCLAGWADCDGNPATGCEKSLTDDPSNCGACRHDCLEGECLDGQCQPFVVYQSPTMSSIEIALGPRFLFWHEAPFLNPGQSSGSGTIRALDLAGGSSVRLASIIVQKGLTAVGDTLYWAEARGEELWLRAVAVGIEPYNVVKISDDSDFEPKCLGADESRIYIGVEDYLLEIDTATGTPTPIAAWQSPCDVMVRAGDFVAWMDPSMDALHTFDVVLRQERVYPLAVRPTWTSVLAASPTAAYWSEGTDPWFVRSLAIETGEQVDLASLASEPSAMVVAGSFLYVGRAGAGVIESIALSGGAPTELATGQATLESLRASDDSIFYSSGRRIKRLAR